MLNDNLLTCSSLRWTKHLISDSKYSSILARSAIVSIKYPSDKEVRSRKVVKRSNFRMTTKYPSWKMGRMLECESSHELNAYRVFDANPKIDQIFDQPFELLYKLDGETYRHFPDALTISGDSKTVWEIKQEPKDEDLDILLRSDVLGSLFAARGVIYRLAGGNDFSKEPFLSNSKLLLEYGRDKISARDMESAVLFFRVHGFAIWASFKINESLLLGRQVLARLALEGNLVFDIGEEIGSFSYFHPSTTFHSYSRGF